MISGGLDDKFESVSRITIAYNKPLTVYLKILEAGISADGQVSRGPERSTKISMTFILE